MDEPGLYFELYDDNNNLIKCIDESIDERKTLTKMVRSKCKLEIIEKLDYRNLHAYITKLLQFCQIKQG